MPILSTYDNYINLEHELKYTQVISETRFSDSNYVSVFTVDV